VFLNKGFKTLILFGKAWKLNFAMALEKAFFSSPGSRISSGKFVSIVNPWEQTYQVN